MTSDSSISSWTGWTHGVAASGSIFRLIVGTAVMKTETRRCDSWGRGNTASRTIREDEQPLEAQVSEIIGQMPFLWLAINDAPGPDSLRGLIERNSIALLSHFEKDAVDPPSPGWLGHSCNRPKVRASGLWNQNHVEEDYDPAFLDLFSQLINQTEEDSR